MKEIIETLEAPNPIGPYSQAIRANGFVFVSGQIPIKHDSDLVVKGGIEAQTHQAIGNISAILKAAGTDLDRVVKTTVFCQILMIFPDLIKYTKSVLWKQSLRGLPFKQLAHLRRFYRR